MRRFVLIPILLAIVVAVVGYAPAWAVNRAPETGSWTEASVNGERAGQGEFALELKASIEKVKSQVVACAHTFVTVVRTLVNAILTVVVAIASLVLRLALVLLLAFAHLLI